MQIRIGMLLAIAGACSPAYRAFVAPAPIKSPGPATAATEVCSNRTAEIVDYEAARERATLDAWLRKTGGMLLTPRADRGIAETKPGAIIRGSGNERLLVIDETDACGEIYQAVAMNAAHEVFVVNAHAESQRHVHVTVCAPDCRGGCGHQQERHAIVVEVPDDARLGRERDLPFPIDVKIDVDPAKTDGEQFVCPKVP